MSAFLRGVAWCWALVNPFHPITADQARLGIQCAVAIAIGCLFCVIDPLWTGLLRTGTWVIVTVLVVLEPNVGSTLRKSWLRVLGTTLGGFGSIAMLELAYAAGGGPEWTENSVPMAVTITVLQSVVGALMLVWKVQHPATAYAYLVTAFTLPVVWVPGLRSEYGQEVVDAIRRLVSILIGIGIPCLVQLTVFPVFACRQLTERLAAALREAVDVLLAAAASAAYQPQNGAALSNGHAAAGPGSHTARLQRAQRKLASGMDKLLDPSATELRFLRGPLSAADLSALVDATSVVGSTTVGLSAVLEAVHTNVPGTDRHPLPVELEERLDATTAALGNAFVALADRTYDTLDRCCLQRHLWENWLWYSATSCCRQRRRAAGAGTRSNSSRSSSSPAAAAPGGEAAGSDPGSGGQGGGPCLAPSAPGVTAALEAAAAQFRQLATAHEDARSGLAPSESDLCVLAMSSCLVLLQQARAVEGVLAALAASASDQAEEVQLAGKEWQADKV